jgi:hypothetical protein
MAAQVKLHWTVRIIIGSLGLKPEQTAQNKYKNCHNSSPEQEG